MAQLLEDKRKSTDKASSKKSKGKRKEGESSSSVRIEEKSSLLLVRLNPRHKEKMTEIRKRFILEE